MSTVNQNLSGPHDLTMLFLGWFAVSELALAAVNLSSKFEVCLSTHYEDMIKNAKYGVVWAH